MRYSEMITIIDIIAVAFAAWIAYNFLYDAYVRRSKPMNELTYIRENTPTPERLAMLAEECTELAHAALKMRRAIDRDASPGAIDARTAEAHMQEEIADVLVCIQVCGGYLHDVEPVGSVSRIMDEKKRRWKERIERNVI